MSAVLPKKVAKWLEAIDDDIEDKDSLQILRLLLKRYFKQRLDFETLITSAEELLQSPNAQNYLEQLNELCYQDQDELETLQEVDEEGYDADQEILHAHLDKSVSDVIDSTSTISMASKKRRKTNNSSAGLITPPDDCNDSEKGSTVCPKEIETKLDCLASKEAEERWSQDTQVSTAFPMDTSASPRSSFLKADKFTQSLKYIVGSLERYSDESLESEEHETIAELQAISMKTDQGIYTDLSEFSSDLNSMLETLETKGKHVEKIRKHFLYLVDYYFPSHGKPGKLRSRK